MSSDLLEELLPYMDVMDKKRYISAKKCFSSPVVSEEFDLRAREYLKSLGKVNPVQRRKEISNSLNRNEMSVVHRKLPSDLFLSI